MRHRATLLAAAISATAVLLLLAYLRRFEAEQSGGPKVAVLMLMKSLEPGAAIHSEDLAEHWVPQAYVEPRAIRSTDRSRVLNIRCGVPLKAQQTLMWTDLVLAGEDDRDMSALVRPGMRATIIRAEGSVAAAVTPGNRVDVLGTFQKPNSSDVKTSVVLLQNVLVLGRKSDGEKRAGSNNELLISVTLAQAEILAVATKKGELSIALRSEDDVHIQDGIPEFSSTALVEAEQKVTVVSKAGPKGPTAVR